MDVILYIVSYCSLVQMKIEGRNHHSSLPLTLNKKTEFFKYIVLFKKQAGVYYLVLSDIQ